MFPRSPSEMQMCPGARQHALILPMQQPKPSQQAAAPHAVGVVSQRPATHRVLQPSLAGSPTVPQVPQFSESVWVLVHCPPRSVSLSVQRGLHSQSSRSSSVPEGHSLRA